MDFGVNKTAVEVINEGAFRGNYFRDISQSINDKWYRKSIFVKQYWSKLLLLRLYCNINVHKCGVKCGTSLRFWENKGWMNSMDPYGWFHGILDIS